MNTRILQFTLSSLMLILSSEIFAEECLKSEWSYTDQNKKHTQKSLLCFKETVKGLLIYSENCKTHQCHAVTELKKRTSETKKEMFGIGSPHFRDCHSMKGSPILISLLYKEKVRKTMFCLFSQDQSLVNTEAIDLWEGVSK